jgi:hypothetical protein
MPETQRSVLEIALFFSVPPVAAVALANVVVVDKTFAVGRLLASRLPASLMKLIVFLFHCVHIIMYILLILGVGVNCNIGTDYTSHPLSNSNNEKCVGALSAIALVRLCLLWVDRFVFAFLDIPRGNTLGAKHRVVNGALMVAAFSALAVQEPMAVVLLLQSFASRATGSHRMDRYLRPAKVVLRIYAAASSVGCVYTGGALTSASRRSAGVAMLVAVSGH